MTGVQDASLIAPRLYLSNITTACDSQELLRFGITHVVSVLEWNVSIPECIPTSNRLQVRLGDCSEANILAYFPKTTEFISGALAENDSNVVLVHCFMGISRSATIVCAYLIATSDMLATEAIAYTRTKREIVCPNLGFRIQLETYAEQFGRRPKDEAFSVIGTIPRRSKRLMFGKHASVR